MLLIPRLFHKNRFIKDFQQNAELSSSFFPQSFFPCQLYQTSNYSKLRHWQRFIDDLIFTRRYRENFSLDPNQVHGNNIRIRMLKIGRDTICKPLGMIFDIAFIYGSFPSESINCYQLPTKFTYLLIMELISLDNMGTPSQTHLKRSIMSGTKEICGTFSGTCEKTEAPLGLTLTRSSARIWPIIITYLYQWFIA